MIANESPETRLVVSLLILRNDNSELNSKITHICRIKGCGGAGWPPHQ